MFKRVFKQVSTSLALSAAEAANVTGAGASFPYPIYAK